VSVTLTVTCYTSITYKTNTNGRLLTGDC
jgi:hypothetical protein